MEGSKYTLGGAASYAKNAPNFASRAQTDCTAHAYARIKANALRHLSSKK